MAHPNLFFFLVFLFFLLLVGLPTPFSAAQQTPRALVLPVSKDPFTLQYTVLVGREGEKEEEWSPSSSPVALTLDLNAPFSWLDCNGGVAGDRVSSVPCLSAQCAAFDPHGCGSHDKACLLRIHQKAFNRSSASGRLTQGTISIPSSTDGGEIVAFRRFLFACAPNTLLKGLPSGVKGVAGLGRTQVSLPSQLAAAFSLQRKFALCLTSSSYPSPSPSKIAGSGVVFFGDGPYSSSDRLLLPADKVISDYLTYTPLLIRNRGEYHIGVKSIRVNEKPVPLLNTTTAALLSAGGAKLSTVDPYTVLESSIYRAVAGAFIKESKNLIRVAPVAPFQHCFEARGLDEVPAAIDLVLQSESVAWRVPGANSMVPVGDGGVLCLGFVDGGPGLDVPVVIGGYQMEDHLLQFDAAASRLGFSPPLFLLQTSCSDLDFFTH